MPRGGFGGFRGGYAAGGPRPATCYKCGGPNHYARDCQAQAMKCYACGKLVRPPTLASTAFLTTIGSYLTRLPCAQWGTSQRHWQSLLSLRPSWSHFSRLSGHRGQRASRKLRSAGPSAASCCRHSSCMIVPGRRSLALTSRCCTTILFVCFSVVRCMYHDLFDRSFVSAKRLASRCLQACSISLLPPSILFNAYDDLIR